jgi:hypothetical protein
LSWRLRRGAAFFASPGGGQGTSGHGETARWYQVQIDGSEVTCHDEIVLDHQNFLDSLCFIHPSFTSHAQGFSIATLQMPKEIPKTVHCQFLVTYLSKQKSYKKNEYKKQA